MNHPHRELGLGKKHLILEVDVHGSDEGEWSLHAECVSAEQPYHPPANTPKPRTQGVESATVVGPAGEEIHTDEFGRVRVQFHWDREGNYDDNSSCWIHVSQPWGGAGYGGSNLPRVGQEVLVDFLGGDPDRPVITGRVFTNLQKTPYKLPDNKTQSGWKSNSTGQTGGYNEIMFEDAAGRELVRMQAERDRDTLVKNDSNSSILGNRTTFVGGDNSERVAKNESLTVTKQRSVTVMETMSHTVKSGISSTCQEGNTSFETAQRFSSHAEEQVFDADVKLLVSVGGASTIYMTRDYIILNSPKVLINPGADALAAAMNDQPLPPSDSEREAAEKQQREAEARERALQVETGMMPMLM
jgi:type VI secretion system secreted protein VgrG